jgi:hypothetical protein
MAGTLIKIAYPIDLGLVPTVLVLVLITGFFAQDQNTLAAAATPKHVVWVKYRQTPVDLADRRFEYLDTSRSSFITGAWYDGSNSYMVIGLRGTYYFDCRLGGVPVY